MIGRGRDPRELLGAQTLPLAVRRNTEYLETHVSLSSGDTVVYYTDGVVESENERGAAFGKDRLLVAACGESGSAQAVIERIDQDLARSQARVPRLDDQTLLVLCAT